jgi:hypothetical protein
MMNVAGLLQIDASWKSIMRRKQLGKVLVVVVKNVGHSLAGIMTLLYALLARKK